MIKKHIRMIGLDLDGTLLDNRKVLTDYTRQVLIQAIEQGVIVLPATGRPMAGVPDEILQFPGIQYALTANGARVMDVKAGEILYENLVPYETGSRLLDIFRRYDTLLEVYYDGVGYAEEKVLERIADFFPEAPMANYILTTRKPIDNVPELFHKNKKATDKVQAVFADIKDKEQALKDIARLVPDVEVTGALSNNIEVNAKDVNKGKALVRLGESLGISREEIMACGDGANDIEMLKEVGFGVAMGNSIDLVKAAADHVTLTNDEDGAARAIEKYVLL